MEKKHCYHSVFAIDSNLGDFKSDALKIALLAVLSSCQAGGDRH